MGIGVYAGVWVVLWLLRESYLTALIILGVTIWAFGFTVNFFYTMLGAAKPRIETGAAGTLLRSDRFADASLNAATGAIFAAATLYLIFAPFGMVDYTPTGVMRVAVPASCVFLVMFGAPTLYRTLKHRGGGHLRLDPGGFEVWNGQWGSFRRGEWDEIEQIRDKPAKGSTPLNEVIIFVLPKGRSAMLISNAITGNSRALLEWVRFYWRHPEYRGELTDGRALRRLEEETFTTE
ncbi:hypothetical protein [Mycolicibacterium pulveris]|uniref:hypothetical protein n=1 Tax=Mycolicibacterium pulveris TaxID=36813 RepID=UPI003CE7AF59